MTNRPTLLIALLMVFAAVLPVCAQEQPVQQPSAEELEKQKAEFDKNAYRLLDQVIDEAQSLRLTENRVRVQINAAELLWDHNQGRARSLFSLAADGVAEILRTPDTGGRQQGPNQGRRPTQLRQDLVLAAARHDAPLAYQLLAATRPASTTPTAATDRRNPRAQLNSEENLEQALLAQVAALDPKMAAQTAEQMLEKGQFPRSLTQVINQLQRQDQEAAAKLTDKTLKRIQAANILTNSEASSLALALLAPGPRMPVAAAVESAVKAPLQPRGPVLDQSPYTDLLSTVIDSAMKATPQNNQRGPNTQRGRGPGVGSGGPNGGPNNTQVQPTDAQIEQANARRLLGGLQAVLPQIDQYLPSRAQAVRQKMTEVGMGDSSRTNAAQAFGALQQGNVNTDTLMQAAAVAPQQMQARIYQQAAFRALDDGNTDLARQIATDHLQANARDAVMQRIDFREMSKKAEGVRIDEIRRTIARLQSDGERIDLLLQVAIEQQKTDPKLTLQLLEEARQITNRRATSYDNFEQQLKVAHAFAAIEPARSFEVLEPGISHLNELLSAAALLSGFEINLFRDGELPLQGGNGLTATITRYGQELALLARSDFERSEMLAGRFQYPEPRILARLSIVQGLLGIQSEQPSSNFFRGQNFNFRPQ
jgi:hypothetical protein